MNETNSSIQSKEQESPIRVDKKENSQNSVSNVKLQKRDPLKGLRSGYIAAFAICSFLIAGLFWASISKIETAVHADGTVVPIGSNRKAQHLEGGIVKEMLVKDGQEVQAGQILVRIAPEQAESALGQREVKIKGLVAQVARLKAEAEAKDRFPVPTGQGQEWLNEERAFVANREALSSRIQTYREQARRARLDAKSKEAQLDGLHGQEIPLQRSVGMQQAAISAGGGSPGRLVEAQAQLAAVRAQMAALPSAIESDAASAAEAASREQAELHNSQADAASKLASAQSELDSSRKDAESVSDRLTRTDVRSPVHGVIQKLYVNDVGEVVPPNSTVADIVPLGDGLVIEARIKPEDMRGLKVGMPSLVRMSAFDVSRYGTLDGRVVSLSPDVSRDEKNGQSFYRVRIETEQNQIGGEPVKIGMQASVDIITGERTVLEYLIAPVVDWKSIALRDR